MKTGIFNYSGKAPNQGGPNGYLYNLYEGFDEKSDFPELLFVQNSTNISSNNASKNSSVLRRIAYYFKQGMSVRKKLLESVNDFDVIHSERSEDVVYLRLFCNYKGKLIFTPHRPEPLFNEKRQAKDSPNGLYSIFCRIIEVLSYRLSDAFIFPSPGAMSIYHSFPGFDSSTKLKPINYVYTGVAAKRITIDRNEYRQKLGLSSDLFIIGFVGRHNQIKGYDRIVSAYSFIEANGLTVLAAGSKDGIAFPQKEDWLELGYINDVQNLLNAVDVVTIPNRNTYFDLIIIEALALGKIVISSNTGGNIDIAKQTKGLVLFDNEIDGSFENALSYVLHLTDQEKSILENENKAFYNNNCNIERFSRNYLQALNKTCLELNVGS